MRNTSSRGFVDLTLLVAVIVVVLIGGFVWWRVQQYEEPKIANSTLQTQESETDVPAETDEEIVLDDVISYKTPQDWHEKSCETTDITLAPTEAQQPDCDSPGRPFSVFVMLVEKVNEEFDCDSVEASRSENSTCSSVSVNGNQVTLINDKTGDPFGTGYFERDVALISNGTYSVRITYDQQDDKNTYQADFDQLVESIEFK